MQEIKETVRGKQLNCSRSARHEHTECLLIICWMKNYWNVAQVISNWIYFPVMKKNAISHPTVKQQTNTGQYGFVSVHFPWAEVKPLAIEQEKVNQSSIAANKNKPLENVWGPSTVNN